MRRGDGKSGNDLRVPEDVVAGECCRGDFRGCGEIRTRLCEVHLPVQASGRFRFIESEIVCGGVLRKLCGGCRR